MINALTLSVPGPVASPSAFICISSPLEVVVRSEKMCTPLFANNFKWPVPEKLTPPVLAPSVSFCAADRSVCADFCVSICAFVPEKASKLRTCAAVPSRGTVVSSSAPEAHEA